MRCGQCRRGFDALAHLSDGLPEEGNPVVAATDAAPSEPQGETLEAYGLQRRDDSVAGDSAQADRVRAELPEVLLEDEPNGRRTPGLFTTLALITVAALLALALAGQYVWFRTAAVVDAYPQSRDIITKVCRSFGCVPPPARDPSKMRLVARDVRLHPRYEAALLVTASMVNKALIAQPWPRLEFVLYDINGQAIASRVLEPKEYVQQHDRLTIPLEPLQPLQIGFELLAPEEEIISFEFRFL